MSYLTAGFWTCWPGFTAGKCFTSREIYRMLTAQWCPCSWETYLSAEPHLNSWGWINAVKMTTVFTGTLSRPRHFSTWRGFWKAFIGWLSRTRKVSSTKAVRCWSHDGFSSLSSPLWKPPIRPLGFLFLLFGFCIVKSVTKNVSTQR